MNGGLTRRALLAGAAAVGVAGGCVPALASVCTMHQNDCRANMGEVACTTAIPPGASRARSTR